MNYSVFPFLIAFFFANYSSFLLAACIVLSGIVQSLIIWFGSFQLMQPMIERGFTFSLVSIGPLLFAVLVLSPVCLLML